MPGAGSSAGVRDRAGATAGARVSVCHSTGQAFRGSTTPTAAVGNSASAAGCPPISGSIAWKPMNDSPGPVFHDTNVLLHLLSSDERKADLAEGFIAAGGFISVQVLTEAAAVASRKLLMNGSDIRDFLGPLRTVLTVVALAEEMHESSVVLAEKYRLSFHDASIVAAALDAGCVTLFSEDMHTGPVFEKQLTVRNPFGRVRVGQPSPRRSG